MRLSSSILENPLCFQESHKQMDDDAELDAEIAREIAEEARNNEEEKKKKEAEEVGCLLYAVLLFSASYVYVWVWELDFRV